MMTDPSSPSKPDNEAIHDAAIDCVLLCFAGENDEDRYNKVRKRLYELCAAPAQEGHGPMLDDLEIGGIRELADRLDKYARDVSNSYIGGTQHTWDCATAADYLRHYPQKGPGPGTRCSFCDGSGDHPGGPPGNQQCPKCDGAGWLSACPPLPQRSLSEYTLAELQSEIQQRKLDASVNAERTKPAPRGFSGAGDRK